MQEFVDALRAVDAVLCATLGLLIVAFYTRPRNRPTKTYQWLIVWSWAAYVTSNLFTNLVLIGRPPDARLAVRLVSSVIGLVAMYLAYQCSRKHVQAWEDEHGLPR